MIQIVSSCGSCFVDALQCIGELIPLFIVDWTIRILLEDNPTQVHGALSYEFNEREKERRKRLPHILQVRIFSAWMDFVRC